MKSRRKFTSEFKAKVALSAIKEQKTVTELAQEYELHPNQINSWKKEFVTNSFLIFESGSGKKGQEESVEKEKEKLYSKIGQLQIEVDFLKKALS